ncbi:MAG: tRNA (adenosine(37)-N6)-dimethylallyltransferase MiaA [Clostridia bacterium]|nr:tRNA (adenosine(37)-N6)-dimethylallyltransferase MiaA [Clostridia bacterium]
MIKIVVVAGPTASGKSSFGVDIAKKINGEVISCDSMQVYREMNIGTAKISRDEMNGVKHRLIDIVDPKDEFSVGEYSLSANKIIKEISNQGKIPVIVGGTGLYIDSILYPMTFGGSKNIEIRKSLENDCKKYGKEYMHGLLAQIDPEDAAKIHPNNVKRVLRALEIYKTTGKYKSDMQNSERKIQYDCCMVVLNPRREVLYKRIDCRVDDMFERGLAKEVNELLSSGVSFEDQSMQAIGYKEFRLFYDKTINEAELKDKIKQNSRNYAKRQITWLKRYGFAKWFDPESQIDLATDFILKSIRGNV